jgi:hypothetical protein
MLVCRAALGRVFTIPENCCDYIGKSLVTAHETHSGRDRFDCDKQFVVFDPAQLLPLAHIHYL